MYLCSRSTQQHRSVAGFEAMDALSGVLVRIGEFHVGNFYISNLPDGVSLLLISLHLLRYPEELMRNITLLGWPYSFARVSINDSANWRWIWQLTLLRFCCSRYFFILIFFLFRVSLTSRTFHTTVSTRLEVAIHWWRLWMENGGNCWCCLSVPLHPNLSYLIVWPEQVG